MAGRSPGRAVVAQDAPGPAMALEHRLQASAHRLAGLLAAGPDLQGVAGMVVQHRQRMTTSRVQTEPALEIHLPKVVGLGVFEANPVARLARSRTVQDAAPAGDRGDRRGRRSRRQALVQQNLADLAPAPAGVLATHRQDLGFHGRRGPARARQRPARPIRQPCEPMRPIRLEPLVARRRADPEPSTQLPNLRPRPRGQAAKFLPLRHQRTLLERHAGSSASCQKCPPCLRTPVHYLPGLYIRERGLEAESY